MEMESGGCGTGVGEDCGSLLTCAIEEVGVEK